MFDRLIIRNFFLYGMYQAMRLAFPLVATPFLTHTLKKDVFADYAIINSCLWTSSVFMDFGFFLYGVSKTATANTEEDLRQVVTSISLSKLSLLPITSAVFLGMTFTTGVLTREPVAALLGLVGAICYGGNFAWYFQGKQKGFTAVLTEAIPQFVQFALLLSLVRAPRDLWLVMLLQALPPVSSMTYSVLYLRRAALIGKTSLLNVWGALKAAWPFFVERFCFAAYTAVMPSIIVLLSVKSEVAYYSIGERVGSLIVSLCAPLNQAFMPRAAKAAHDPDGGWRFSIRLIAFESALIIAFAGAVAISIGFIIRKFFTPDYAPAILVARIFCVIGCVSSLGTTVASFILIPRDRASVMIWSSGLALVLGLVAQFALIPTWGAPGAALGRLASHSVVLIVLGIASTRLFFEQKPQYAAHM